MPADRQSSRARFAAYQAQRRTDRTWAEKGLEGKADEAAKKRARTTRHRSFFALFREFWSLTRRHHGWIYLALTTLTIVACTSLVIPASTKLAVDYAMTPGKGPTDLPDWARETFAIPDSNTGLLWWLGAAMTILALCGVTLGTVGRWQMTRVTKRIQAELRTRAFRHAITLPLHRIHHHKTGGMSSLLREDAGLAGELTFSMIYNPWRAIIQLFGTLVILASVDWRMLVGGLLLLPAVWITHKTYIARIRPLYRDAKHVRSTIDAFTTEAFGGVRVVRGFGRERAEKARFNAGQHYFTRIEVLTWWWARAVEVAWAVLIPVASAGVLIYGGTQVINGSLSIGDVMMFSTYLLMLLGPLETLTSTAANIQSNLAALDRILDLLAEQPEFGGKRAGVVVRPETTRGQISLTDVWFAYPRPPERQGRDPAAPPPEEPAPVLRAITLRVNPGETIALVGRSGSGKTTLCNLIARFYDPTRGVVSLDGTDLRDIDVSSYRRLLGIVEQDVFLFDGTIEQNIAYGRRDVPRAAVENAARAANAHDFISAFDKGYATVIGERGVRLSGGQKQRIAIARALLADPRILILDEATSNLDSESEALIQHSLAALMKGRTCFVIAHRLSTVRSADRIVVLDDGAIIEQGTHEELSAAGGRYADLLRIQLGPAGPHLAAPAAAPA